MSIGLDSDVNTGNSTKRKVLDKALMNMIVTDLQPSSIVEGVGFKNFVSVLDPR